MKYEDMDIVLRTEERKRERERAREIYLSTHPWETIPNIVSRLVNPSNPSKGEKAVINSTKN
jgi:hypothetical protein